METPQVTGVRFYFSLFDGKCVEWGSHYRHGKCALVYVYIDT